MSLTSLIRPLITRSLSHALMVVRQGLLRISLVVVLHNLSTLNCTCVKFTQVFEWCSLSILHSYWVSTLSMGKPFFLFNWSLFQSRCYNCTWLVCVRLKNEPMQGGGEEPMAMQPAIARQNGRDVWLYNRLPATASQISSKEATERAAHSTAKNAVLIPISQGTEVMIATEYVPFRHFTRTSSSIDA